MDTDKFRNFIAIGLILYACVNVLMKFMPNIATQLPLPVYEFFYSITVKLNQAPLPKVFHKRLNPTLHNLPFGFIKMYKYISPIDIGLLCR